MENVFITYIYMYVYVYISCLSDYSKYAKCE